MELRELVRGFVWKARMINGAIFEWWTPSEVSRATARREVLAVANGHGYTAAYDETTIESLWQTKGVR